MIKKHLPNAITCGNLFCGAIAIVLAFKGETTLAIYFVFAAAVLDFLDGFAARLLKSYSEIGKQLDSLADMVTFGVVPGVVMFLLMTKAGLGDYAYFGFFISVFSALRLAKFNIDTRQTDSFIGLPVPANTLLIGSLILILENDSFNIGPFILNPYVLFSVTAISCYMMVAEIPLFSLKFKNASFKDNRIRYIFLISSILLITGFFYASIPLIIILYVVLSAVNNRNSKF